MEGRLPDLCVHGSPILIPMSQLPIKVFLVEDSPVALSILQKLLESAPDIEVVGTARNGIEALEKIPKAAPDVICTDLLMGKMGGLELTQQLMMHYPRPILVVSQAVQQTDTDTIFRLLEAGAVDVFSKPKTGLKEDYDRSKDALLYKIRVLSGVKVFKKKLSTSPSAPPATSTVVPSKRPIPEPSGSNPLKILAIGGSTGGPQAFHKILSKLPADFPLPIVCVQHISEGFLAGLVGWLDAACLLKVKIAEAGESPLPGHVYYAPEGHHLSVDRQGRFTYSAAPPVSNHRPSVSVTFQALAEVYGSGTIGVLLTGMGRDGADGMKAIAQTSGLTIAQDEASCVIFGMPHEAIQLGAVQHVLDIADIAAFLVKAVRTRSLS
jgi:two-component system, chemotaxis family, protein-glutamate methylesterase/glutaminase